MKTYRHINWNGKRDYECTNVCACRAEAAPDANWIEDAQAIAGGMTRLETRTQGGATVEYWGYL